MALQAVMEASETLVGAFRDRKEVIYKGRGNVVTNLDYQVEKQVIDLLQKEYPRFGVLSEEGRVIEGQEEYTWVLDPLDGTRNYASGNPLFSVNLGLAHRDEVVLGITYDPLQKELFRASKGKGAFLNDSPISVSQQTSVQASVLGLDMGYSDERGKQALQMLVSLWPGMQTIRIMGSAALGLAYAAAGRLDLYFHHSLAPWDLVSGILLVQEAGGVITDGDGARATFWSKSIIASNEAIHADFLRVTEGCEWRRATPESGSSSRSG
ncbi:MAG: inositol monophosphatase [Dehalococcoidia bacterium]